MRPDSVIWRSGQRYTITFNPASSVPTIGRLFLRLLQSYEGRGEAPKMQYPETFGTRDKLARVGSRTLLGATLAVAILSVFA